MRKEKHCPYREVSAIQQGQTAENYIAEVISHPDFVCIFGKAALRQQNICFHSVEGVMESVSTVREVCAIIYAYIANVLQQIDFSEQKLPLASCVIVFPNQTFSDEDEACKVVSRLLVEMHRYDSSQGHVWAPYVSSNPKSETFSFSIGGEAFFVPLLYEHSHSYPRKTGITALVFNWHKLFEELRRRDLFAKGREVIRKRTISLGYPVAELLADFGQDLEFPQYVLPALANLDLLWKCLYEYGGNTPFGEYILGQPSE